MCSVGRWRRQMLCLSSALRLVEDDSNESESVCNENLKESESLFVVRIAGKSKCCGKCGQDHRQPATRN